MIDPENPRSGYLEVYEISIMTDYISGSKVSRNLVVSSVKNVNVKM
jgi:hypothetical protein